MHTEQNMTTIHPSISSSEIRSHLHSSFFRTPHHHFSIFLQIYRNAKKPNAFSSPSGPETFGRWCWGPIIFVGFFFSFGSTVIVQEGEESRSSLSLLHQEDDDIANPVHPPFRSRARRYREQPCGGEARRPKFVASVLCDATSSRHEEERPYCAFFATKQCLNKRQECLCSRYVGDVAGSWTTDDRATCQE